MYILTNVDSMMDNKVYMYLHNFLFYEEMLNPQSDMYAIKEHISEDILTIID